jgi:hypothetical protein
VGRGGGRGREEARGTGRFLREFWDAGKRQERAIRRREMKEKIGRRGGGGGWVREGCVGETERRFESRKGLHDWLLSYLHIFMLST